MANIKNDARRTSDRRSAMRRRKKKKYQIVLPERYADLVSHKQRIEESVDLEEKYEGPSIAEIEQQIIEKKKELIKQIPKLLESAPKKELFLVHKLAENLVKIYDGCSPVLGINLK